MAHHIRWLVEDRILLAEICGHQTEQSLKTWMDDLAEAFGTCRRPFAVLIDWDGVTECDLKALLNMRGHPVHSHAMLARTVLVGMDALARFEYEIAAVKTRDLKITQYCDTMDEAMTYLDDMLMMQLGLSIPYFS